MTVHDQTLPDIDPLSPNPLLSSVGVVSQLSTLSKMKPWVLEENSFSAAVDRSRIMYVCYLGDEAFSVRLANGFLALSFD